MFADVVHMQKMQCSGEEKVESHVYANCPSADVAPCLCGLHVLVRVAANGNQQPAGQTANKGLAKRPDSRPSLPRTQHGSTTVSASHFGAPSGDRLDCFARLADEKPLATDMSPELAELVAEFGANCMFQVGEEDEPKFACGWCGKAYRNTCALCYHLKLGCCTQHVRYRSSHGEPSHELESRSHIASFSQQLGHLTPRLPVDDYEQLDVQNVLDPEFCSHVSNAEEETGGGGDTDGPDVREVLRELLMDRLLLEHLPVVMQDHLGKEVEQHDTSMPHMRPHPHQRSLRQEGQDEEEQGTCAVEEQHVEPAWLHVLQQTRLWENLSHAHDTETYIDVENHGHVEDQMLDLYALQNSASQLAVGQGDLGVMCHGSSFGRDATVTRASNGEMELLDVTQDDVLPGQVSSPTRRSVPARPSAYSRAGASLHAEGGAGGRRPEELVAGTRFGEGDGGAAPARRGVQFADVESPRGKPKKKIGFVGGEMNYEIILSQKEKELIKAKTLHDQIESALTQMRDLRFFSVPMCGAQAQATTCTWPCL